MMLKLAFPPFGTRALLARNLRRVRLERGWSQATLAEHSGLHLTTVGALEGGKLNATLDVLDRVASALKVPLYTLLMEQPPLEHSPDGEGSKR